MAGVYLHIPYCKQKCHYCDFHFSTSLTTKDQLLDAMLSELSSRASYVDNEEITTIYFGGGTPSILSSSEIENFLGRVNDIYNVSTDAEITLEANPDDLTDSKLGDLKSIGVNRLSIGIQSFDDKVLEWMNRAHNRQQIDSSLEDARKHGFDNINVDLIYGITGVEESYWETQLEELSKWKPEHLSAYHLTIEQGTYFGHLASKGELSDIDDELSVDQFNQLKVKTSVLGLHHYEISNFAMKGFESRHNSSYWRGKKYIGIGPSAHSYDGDKRSWNVSNNISYIKAISQGSTYSEEEILSSSDKINDYILTRLRTSWGIELPELKEIAGDQFSDLEKEILEKTKSGELKVMGNSIVLDDKVLFLADRIASELFV